MRGPRTWITFLAVFLPFLLSASSVFSISLVLSQLTSAFRVPLGELLLAIPIDFIGGAIGGIALGRLADSHGRRPALLISSALFGASVLLSSFSVNVFDIWILWFLVGFGVNAQNGVSYAVIVELTKAMRGSIGGAVQGLYFLGLFLDSAIYYYIRYWRLYLASIGALSLIISVPLTYMMQETFSGERATTKGLIPRGNAGLTALFAVYALAAFMFSVPLSSVAPDIALALGMHDWYIMFLSVLGFVSFFTAGLASDRANRAIVTILYASIGVVGSAMAMAFGLPWAVLPALYFSSGFFSYAGIWISESYPIEQRATASNFIFLFGRLIGGFSPEIVVFLSFSGLYKGLALSSLLSASMAVVSAFLLYRTRVAKA